MPQDKLPIKDFAAKIKAKYPQYASVSDDVLVQKIVAKYPEYEAQVDLSPLKKKEGQPSPKPGAPLNAGTPPIFPSTSTSTSPSGLPLFGAPKAKPTDKIGVQVQQNEEKRRAESFDDVEASFKEVMELQRSVSTETDTKMAIPYATANSMDAVRGMKERDRANLQLAQQRKDALLKEKGDVLFAPVRELLESGKAKDFFDASGNFKTGKAIEYFSGVVGEKGGGTFTRQLLVNTLRKEGATLSPEQKADLKKNTDAGVKSVAGRVGLAKKSMVAGWYQTLANYGHKMASEGIDNALSRYLQSKDYDYQQWAPGQYEWNGKEWIDRAITSGGQSIGGSLPSLIPSTIATLATGGLAGTVIGAGIGYTGEKASITGSIYDQVLQQTGDPALARKKADEVGHALEITAPAYLLSSAATLKTFKPGSFGAKALGFGLEAAEEYPVEFYQGWQEAKATQGYKGSLTDYVQENPQTALDILVATTGQSTGIAVAGKILRTLNAKTPAARNQLYADIVSKHGVDFGLAVIDQHYQSGELSEEGFAKEKAELLQTAEQLKAFEGLGIKGEDAKAYVAVSKQVQDLKGKLGATEDPTLRSALEIKIKQAEKNLNDIVGGKGAYAVITYPGGAGQTAVIPLTDLQGMERSGEIDELVRAADQIEIVGDEALNEQYQERKKALGTPEAPEGFYSKPSVILPSDNKRSGEIHTVAPKKEEPSKTAPSVIRPAQNKPAPVTTIAPKEVKTEAKADTRPAVILPSANKAPSVTTVSPQTPAPAPPIEGEREAERGEMQVGSDEWIEGKVASGEIHRGEEGGITIPNEQRETIAHKMKTGEPMTEVEAWLRDFYEEDFFKTPEEIDPEFFARKKEFEKTKGKGLRQPSDYNSIEEFKNDATPEELTELEEFEALHYKTVALDKDNLYKPFKMTAKEKARFEELRDKYAKYYWTKQSDVSPQSPSPTPTLVESERGALEKGETQVGGGDIDLSGAKLNYHVSKSPTGVQGEIRFGDGLHGNGFYTATSKATVPFGGDAETFVIMSKKPFEESWSRQYRNMGSSNEQRTQRLQEDGYDTIVTGDYEVAIGDPKQVIKITENTKFTEVLKQATDYFGNKEEAQAFLDSKGIALKKTITKSTQHESQTTSEPFQAATEGQPLQGVVEVSEKSSPISPSKKEVFREAILSALESANGSEFSEVISDIALQDSDRKTAVKNIRKGKSTVATRKVEEAIEKMWADGYVYLNRGRGDHAESYQMPIAEFLERISQNDEAFQDLSRQAQNLQASLDALGEDLFGETVEEVVGEVRGEMQPDVAFKSQNEPTVRSSTISTTEDRSGNMTQKNKPTPTGAPSKLSDEQYALVRTPEFKAWFGDWENDPKNASQMIDEETGEPMVYHHGTGKDFEQFEDRELGGRVRKSGMGNFMAWFTEQKELAIDYATGRLARKKDGSYQKGWTPMRYGAFLNIRKPMIVEGKAGNFHKLELGKGEPKRIVESSLRAVGKDPKNYMQVSEDETTMSAEQLAAAARRLGYDALIVRDVYDRVYENADEAKYNELPTNQSISVFAPENIKIAEKDAVLAGTQPSATQKKQPASKVSDQEAGFKFDTDLLGDVKMGWMYAVGEQGPIPFPDEQHRRIITMAKEEGMFSAAVKEGRITTEDAIRILTSAGLQVPAEIRNNQSPQSNELKTPSTPSQDTNTPEAPTEGSNEATGTTGSPAQPAEGSKGQEVTVHDFKNPDDLKRLKAQPSQILKFNQGATYGTVYLLVDPEVKNAYAKDKGISVGYNDEKSRGDSPLKDIAKQYRKKDGDVIIDLRTGKSTPKKSGTYEAKARKLAQKLDNMKMPDWFSVKDPNVKKMGLDAESMKKAFKAIIIDTGILLDKGVEAGEALRRGAEAMVAFVEEGYKKIGGKLKPEAAEAIRAGFTRDAAQIFGITGDGTPPADATIEEDDPSNPTRRFSRRVLKDDTILKGVKPGVEAAMEYTRQTNAMSVQEASEVINRVGADDAYDLVVNDKGLKPAVRVVLGQMLIKKYNQMAEEAAAAGDTERENRYLDKTIDVANYVSEKFGTEAGQMIQALSLFERLTPEAQLRAAQKEVKAIGKKKAEKRRKDIEEVGKKLQAANEEAAEELTQSPKVKKAVEKTESERVKKAKDKIEAARKKRENLIKKFRGDKGKNLYSTPGLTPEGIEFVGEMALTYLAEGVANVEIIADKILSEMKALSGKTPPEEVVRHVSDIVRGHVEKDRATKKAKGLKELEVEIGKVVREHYTVPSEKKTALIDKFMERVGLDKAEATALAEEIQQEFDRIATRKKRALLETEKGRLAKIQKDLDRTEGRQPRELQDEIVRYSNLGALDSEEFFDMVAQKLGVGKLTAKEAKEIKALAERIQKAPEGSPRNEATQDLLAYRANLKGVNAMEVSQAVWYANILSGYKTHLVNIVSTFINGAGFFITEAARSPLSTPVLLYGAARGFHRGLFEAAYTVRTGRSPIHIKKVETPTTLERHQFYGLLYPLNWAKYVGRLMAAEDVVGFQSLKEMRATQLAWREARKQGLRNPFGRATWAHIEKALLNTQERSDEAFAQAQKEGFENAGYKNRAAAAKTIAWKRRVYEIMELSRPVQMTEEAYGFAARGTFNHTPEGFLGALTNAITPVLDIEVNGMRPVRWVIPFTRIITNVVNANLDYTPVGFVRALRGKRGAESFQNMSWTGGAYRELSREERLQVATKAALGILGTAALMALSYVEDEEGEPLIRITASGPEDFERQEQLRQTGWQPYSIKVGGKWYAYKWTPLVFNLSVLGYLKDQEAYGGDDEDTQVYKVTLAIFRTVQQIMDGTFVGSTSALMENLTTNQPSTAMDKTFGTGGKLITQTVVPNLLIQGAQAYESIFSMNQKDAKNAFQRLQQHLPYARNMMNDKINALGEPIPTDVDVFVSPERTHPVFNFLHEKKAWVGRVNPNTFMIYDEQKGEERLGTPDEYYKFARLRGQKIKAEVENIMQNGAFVTYDENDKEVVTLNEDEARDVKPASQITSKEMKQLVRALSVRATKEAKEELFSPEW